MVALSSSAPNNYTKLIKYKRQAHLPQNDTINGNPKSSRYIDDYGETVTSKITNTQKRLTDLEIASIVEDYQNGMTTYALAKKYGCHRNTISRNLKKHGIVVTHSKIKTEEDSSKIISLYKSGMMTEDIADKFLISVSAVVRCLHKNGVKMRTRWDY